MKPIVVAGLMVLAGASGGSLAQDRAGGDRQWRGGASAPQSTYQGRSGGTYQGRSGGAYRHWDGGHYRYGYRRHAPSWGYYGPAWSFGFASPWYYAPGYYAYAPGYLYPAYPEPVVVEPLYAPPPPVYTPPRYAEVAPLPKQPSAPAAPPAPRLERYTLSARELFAFDRDVLRTPQPRLDEIAEALRRNPEIRNVIITGYTDRLGSESYNLRLSERRANAVKEYLVRKGVEAARLHTSGRGEANPVVQCNDHDRAALIRCLEPNRRVEVEEFTVERPAR